MRRIVLLSARSSAEPAELAVSEFCTLVIELRLFQLCCPRLKRAGTGGSRQAGRQVGASEQAAGSAHDDEHKREKIRRRRLFSAMAGAAGAAAPSHWQRLFFVPMPSMGRAQQQRRQQNSEMAETRRERQESRLSSALQIVSSLSAGYW